VNIGQYKEFVDQAFALFIRLFIIVFKMM